MRFCGQNSLPAGDLQGISAESSAMNCFASGIHIILQWVTEFPWAEEQGICGQQMSQLRPPKFQAGGGADLHSEYPLLMVPVERDRLPQGMLGGDLGRQCSVPNSDLDSG